MSVPSIASSTFTDVDGREHRLFGIWYPLGDSPITIRLSREQVQALHEELRGQSIFPGWKEYFADQLEGVLKASLDAPTTEMEEQK